MGVCVSKAVARADVLVSGVGYAPSTLWQYRWAWSQIREFCSQQEVTELSDEVVASFLGFVTAEHRAGRCKEWKRKLLRRALLVLSEAATTGSYTWTVFRGADANGGLNPLFGPLQRRYEYWLTRQGLARATADLYATVARTVLAWLPEREVTDVRRLTGPDMSAAVVFLGGRYQPGSMRTALRQRWGASTIIGRGHRHDAAKLPALIAEVDGKRLGLAAYRMDDEQAELVTLDSLAQGRGLGGALLLAVRERAASGGCRRLWLVTTNDNLDAIGFYQRRGMRIAAVHHGAVDAARRMKPAIPEVGDYSIPVHDEIELEFLLAEHGQHEQTRHGPA